MRLPNQCLSLMAAMSENWVIGREGDLPWHLPKDFKRFKKKTEGHNVIMGRKTFESLGGHPLPNRTNIVITRQPNYEVKDAVIVKSLEEALNYVRSTEDGEPFVIGGGEIYRLALPFADRIYLTIVHTTLEGDTFFPEFEETAWHMVEQQFMHADEKHDYDYTFYTFERKEKAPQ